MNEPFLVLMAQNCPAKVAVQYYTRSTPNAPVRDAKNTQRTKIEKTHDISTLYCERRSK